MEATELTWADQIDLRASMRKGRQVIKKLIGIKFGGISPDMEAYIDGIDSEEELDVLFERVAAAQTENELVQGN